MSVIRERAKNNFPMVLLTLLSIVQALAFELLWGQILEHPEFYVWSWEACVSWLRVATTLLGIILIWTSYATTVMRFRWVPSSRDTFFPFFIGIVQFVMIECLATEDTDKWLACLAILFAVMIWISHQDMRRARLDGENAEFFNQRDRATLRDFLPAIVSISVLLIISLGIWFVGPNLVLVSVAVFLAFSLMCYQVVMSHRFWEWSMQLEPVEDEASSENT